MMSLDILNRTAKKAERMMRIIQKGTRASLNGLPVAHSRTTGP